MECLKLPKHTSICKYWSLPYVCTCLSHWLYQLSISLNLPSFHYSAGSKHSKDSNVCCQGGGLSEINCNGTVRGSMFPWLNLSDHSNILYLYEHFDFFTSNIDCQFFTQLLYHLKSYSNWSYPTTSKYKHHSRITYYRISAGVTEPIIDQTVIRHFHYRRN